MQPAIEQFRVNVSRVRSLGSLRSAIENQTTAALDLSDILRAQLVLAVSALDDFVHEEVRQGMMEIWRGRRIETPSFKRFPVSLENVRLAAFPGDDWLQTEIRLHHNWRSFQRSENIAEAIRLISDLRIWDEVANHLGRPANETRERLDLIVERRNKIAHEADIDPTRPGERWPIDQKLVDDAIDFIEKVCEAINRVI